MREPILTRIDHVGIACHDLEETVARYETLFGLSVVSRETLADQGVHEAMLLVTPGSESSGGGGSYIQLLQPIRADSPVGRFLDRFGEGIHHIGYGVDDLGQALAQLGGLGVRLVDRRPRHGSMGAAIAFLHPHSLGRVLTELVQAPP